MIFKIGAEYRRRDIHDEYGGQVQGGISTPANHNFILIFTGKSGKQYGYQDGWKDDGIFYFTGEGQVGDMQFLRGNAAIRNHQNEGKAIYLFESTRPGYVKFIDEFVCIGYHIHSRSDRNGQMRDAIIFELEPISSFILPNNEHTEIEKSNKTLEELREKIKSSSPKDNTPKENKTIAYQRSQYVKEYALLRANGICEACGREAPFITKPGNPYLEVHHMARLSDGGPDDPEWVSAICPNCHRRAHYADDGKEYNTMIIEKIHSTEKKLTNTIKIGIKYKEQ